MACVLNSLDTTKNAGPDGVPNLFYKNCQESIVVPLCMLFNKSLRDKTFPSCLKHSFVTPILKNGNPSDVKNYRPVSILNAMSLIFEKCVYTSIIPDILPYLSDGQHGFVRGRSTVSNLVSFSHFVAKALDKSTQVDVVYTDFSKAFDRISHSTLVLKLREFGFQENLVKWFETYLSDRQYNVVLNNVHSRPFYPSSGVPQGSILGPLLFNIYVNDVTHNMSSMSLAYADDLKIFKVINNVRDCIDLQKDLNTLFDWCQLNNLDLNIKKCSIVSYFRKLKPINFEYEINKNTLKRETEHRDLGIKFDSKFSFTPHYDDIIKKSSKVMGFIFRIGKFFKNSESFLQLFNMLCRSILEYGAVVWSPIYKTHSDTIERVQRKFTRYLQFKLYANHSEYDDRLILFKMLSLSQRRLMLTETYLRKIIIGKVHLSLLLSEVYIRCPSRPNRHALQIFQPPRSRTNIFMKSPMIRMQVNHNNYFLSFDILNFELSERNVKLLLLRVVSSHSSS